MTRSLLVLLAALALAAGCATTTRTLRAGQIADHADVLRRDGRAVIPTETGTVTVRADEVVHVRLIDDDGVERTTTITLGRLVDGCADATSPDCLVGRVVDEPVVTRRNTRIDPDAVVAAVVVTALGGAAGWCTVACDDPDRELQNAGAIGGGVALGAVALAGLLLMIGMH